MSEATGQGTAAPGAPPAVAVLGAGIMGSAMAPPAWPWAPAWVTVVPADRAGSMINRAP
jgi:3-hydroxyacyl-CoA dehydrogenase